MLIEIWQGSNQELLIKVLTKQTWRMMANQLEEINLHSNINSHTIPKVEVEEYVISHGD